MTLVDLLRINLSVSLKHSSTEMLELFFLVLIVNYDAFAIDLHDPDPNQENMEVNVVTKPLIQSFKVNDEERSSVNISVSDSLLSAFDLLTDVTKDTETLFGQFEDGFDYISPQNDTEDYSLLDEELDLSINGSSIVVGLFDSVRGVTKNVGKVIGALGNTLVNNREDVVQLADDVESQVDNLGSNIGTMTQEFKNNVKEKVHDFNSNVIAKAKDVNRGVYDAVMFYFLPMKNFNDSVICKLTGRFCYTK